MLNISKKIMLKELTVEQIKGMSNVQLYNVVFGPLIQMKNDIKRYPTEEMKNTAVAVYGATAVPIKRRMETLKILQDPQMIILSGGFSWDGSKLGSYTSSETIERLRNRSNDFIKYFPSIKDEILKEITLDGKFTLEDYKKIIEEKTRKIKEKMASDKNYEEKIKDIFKKNYDGPLNFEEWLSDYTEKYYIQQYIINQWTEADIMYAIYKDKMKKEKGADTEIELDTTSKDTRENAQNCLNIIDQSKKSMRNMIIINEWQYLLRAVLTTRKIAEEQGNHINIIGLGADNSEGIGVKYDNLDSFRTNKVSGLETQLIKMLQYSDVPDYDITQYISRKEIISDGPSIYIDEKAYNFDKEEKNKDNDNDEKQK